MPSIARENGQNNFPPTHARTHLVALTPEQTHKLAGAARSDRIHAVFWAFSSIRPDESAHYKRFMRLLSKQRPLVISGLPRWTVSPVQFIPTSGPAALWVEGYEAVGRTAIQNLAEQLVNTLNVGERKAVVQIADVETELHKLCPKDQYFADNRQDPVAVVLSQLPQDRAPVGPRMLLELQGKGEIPCVGSILTLIDDIFDVYHRLSTPRHVFNIQQLVESELDKNEGSESDRYKKAIAIVIQSLIRVLEWRESEIQAATTLAVTLGWRSHTLAVKHPIETGVRLLLGVHVAPVMPTAIDEFRFLKGRPKNNFRFL